MPDSESFMTREETENWVLATHNEGKVRELTELLARFPVRLRPAGGLALEAPEETGTTFEANAELKALTAAQATGCTAIADDSGVEVDALDGAPGIHTRDWAGPGGDFAVARQRVQERLVALGPGVSRRATYVCVLCVARPDGRARTFRGQTRGTLVWPVRGTLGHGFEPMFLPDGYAITYGEMSPEHRLRVNARAAAMRKLETALFSEA